MSRAGEIEDRAFATYKARILTADRLRQRGIAWNTALLATSTASTIAGIALIAEPDLYGAPGGVLFAAIGVTSLVVSLVVASQNYGARSKEMFVSFRRAQRVSVQAERLRQLAVPDNDPTVDDVSEQYQDLLDESENHSHLDFERATMQIAKRKKARGESDFKRVEGGNAETKTENPPGWSYRTRRAAELTLTALPYATLAVPVIVMVPVIQWTLLSQ